MLIGIEALERSGFFFVESSDCCLILLADGPKPRALPDWLKSDARSTGPKRHQTSVWHP